MGSFNRLALRTQVRERTGLESSLYPTDAEINTCLDASGAELWGILTTKFTDIGLTKSAFNIVANQADYSFTTLSTAVTNFFKLRGLDLLVSGSSGYQPMTKWELEERRLYDRYPNFQAGWPRYVYRLNGDEGFELTPTPPNAGTGRLWYIRTYTPFIDDTSTLNGVNGWEEFVIVDACIKVRAKLDLPIDAFMMQKGALMDRINKEAENLDANKPMRIKQVRDVDVWPY